MDKKTLFIGFLAGCISYVLITLFLPMEYSTKLALGLLLLIVYLAFIFLKHK